MLKVYDIKYTGAAGSPPVTRAQPAINIPAGQLNCVAVPCLREGYLTHLTVRQASGTNVNCTVDIFDAPIPVPAGLSAQNTSLNTSTALYRVIQQQAVGAGNTLAVIYDGAGVPFHNAEGTFTDAVRKLYVAIIPEAGAGNTTWDLRLTMTGMS